MSGITLTRAIGMLVVVTSVAIAQRGAGDWMTSGFDAQRSFWIRSDPKIAKDRLVKEGFQFLWKSGLEKKAPITAPLSLGYYIGYRGFRSFVFSSSGDNVLFAIDSDLKRPEWEKRLGPASSAATTCVTANLARPTVTTFPAAPAGTGGAGRSTAAKSTVGEPHQGAALLAEIAARAAAAARAPRPATPPAFTSTVGLIHAIGGDGRLHSLYLSNGDEPQPALAFLPPDAKPQGFTVTGGFAYTAAGPCGAAAKGVWALDLASKQVKSWEAPSGIAGSAGPAFGPDGTLYLTTAEGQLVALEAKTLRQKGAYRSSAAGFATSPVAFEYRGKTLVAAMAKDGSMHVVDAAAIETALVKTDVAGPGAGFMPSALSSWQDAAGTRWILAATASGVAAWKLVEQNGSSSLVRGWNSRDIDRPMTPVIVNGVIFAISSSATPAILYALDGANGKELWNSGAAIATSIPSNGGVSAGNSQIYVAGADGNIYAFGFPMEH